MLIIGLVVAALAGFGFVHLVLERHNPIRYGVGSVAAVAGAAVTPIAMGQCGFAPETSGVDHLLAYGLMAAGAWVALVVVRSFFERRDGIADDSEAFAGEIRSGGYRIDRKSTRLNSSHRQ